MKNKVKNVALVLIAIFLVPLQLAAVETKAIKSGTYHLEGRNLFHKLATHPVEYINIINSDHFTIHYSLSGDDAVTTAFRDSALSILEQMWEFQIERTGFKAPAGSGDGKVHVYLKDMLTPYGLVYGQTVPLNPYGGVNTQAYIEIDNDYLNYGYTSKGINGLRVTIAHEFFHTIQMAYRYSPQYHYFYEWCSTWMEDLAYPLINDYIYYVNDFFDNPEISIRSSQDNIEYAHALLLKTVELNLGASSIIEILENFESVEEDPFDILLRVIEDNGYQKEDLAQDYLAYCLFTGSRSILNYGFPDSQILPEILLTNGNVGDLSWQSSLHAWGITGGILDGGVQGSPNISMNSNGDCQYFAAIYNNSVVEYSRNNDNASLTGNLGILGVINVSNDENMVNYSAAPQRSGLPENITLIAGYPNPFNSGIKWQYKLDRPGRIDGAIFNIQGREIKHFKVFSGEKRMGVIHWDGNDKKGMACPSGVYILSLSSKEEQIYSKVMKIK